MNCPQCNAEMTELTAADDKVHACADCGEWIDGSQLNALLLHANLSGVASLGGRNVPDEATGTCSNCSVGLVRIEQGQRKNASFYEVCEDCGSVFVPLEPPIAADFDAARLRLIDAFKQFSGKGVAARK